MSELDVILFSHSHVDHIGDFAALIKLLVMIARDAYGIMLCWNGFP